MKLHHWVHKSLSIRYLNLVHNFTTCFSMIQSNIILHQFFNFQWHFPWGFQPKCLQFSFTHTKQLLQVLYLDGSVIWCCTSVLSTLPLQQLFKYSICYFIQRWTSSLQFMLCSHSVCHLVFPGWKHKMCLETCTIVHGQWKLANLNKHTFFYSNLSMLFHRSLPYLQWSFYWFFL